MNFFKFLLLVTQGALLLACSASDGTTPPEQSIRPYGSDSSLEGYELVFSDEFDAEKSSLPDTKKWWYEEGAHGWGNNEIQNYIPAVRGVDSCAVVRDGVLAITLKSVGSETLSVRINSRESWTYGYFEGRLKLPKGKGTWPAFWMLPERFESWPLDGEIDIMEHVGYDPNVILSTIHCDAYNHMHQTEKQGIIKVPTAQEEFHVYAVEWTRDYIKGYVDGYCYFTFENDGKGDKTTWPFNVPFYLKLNLAWGGNWGGAQGLDPTALPATYEIDYIRVFKRR